MPLPQPSNCEGINVKVISYIRFSNSCIYLLLYIYQYGGVSLDRLNVPLKLVQPPGFETLGESVRDHDQLLHGPQPVQPIDARVGLVVGQISRLQLAFVHVSVRVIEHHFGLHLVPAAGNAQHVERRVVGERHVV